MEKIIVMAIEKGRTVVSASTVKYQMSGLNYGWPRQKAWVIIRMLSILHRLQNT